MMTQTQLPFQYQAAKNTSSFTAFAGLPLYLELAMTSGLTDTIAQSLHNKHQGWSDTEMIVALMALQLAGGDCVSDIDKLEHDRGLQTLVLSLATHGMKRPERRTYERRWRKGKERALPSTASIHRYLSRFHHEAEEYRRVAGEAFIPKPNGALEGLLRLTAPLLSAMQQVNPCTQATLDQDATLVPTEKRTALYCYKGFKAYQPLNTYWAEQGVLVHSEFRDGNVPAGYEQLRVLKSAVRELPDTVTEVLLRSDSAGYQEDLLRYCAEGRDPRFGAIEFAIALKVSATFKEAVSELPESAWQTLSREDGQGGCIATSQQWAEVCFVPRWAAKSPSTVRYRFLALREALTHPPDDEDTPLPFPTLTMDKQGYKVFGVVTNRDIPGNELVNWHRERCGRSEDVHHIQKADLGGGQLPSHRFGANAAWWELMVLSFNLARLLQVAALPKDLQHRDIKGVRWQVIQLPGRLIRHARRYYLQLEASAYELVESIRQAIGSLTFHGGVLCNPT